MHAVLSLLFLAGFAAANPPLLRLPYLARGYDEGQWHPESDGSILGSGAFRWGLDDGSWKPQLDGSYLGRGDLTWLHRRKRDLAAVNSHSLALPADEPINAIAKNAHLIQYQTEAARNAVGGIPLNLPADTPEVAATKQAHAIAHENEKLATASPYGRYAVPYGQHTVLLAAPPVAARLVSPYYRYNVAATPYSIASPYYNYGLGIHTKK